MSATGKLVSFVCQLDPDTGDHPVAHVWTRDEAYGTLHQQARLQAEQSATIDLLLGGKGSSDLPPAPEGCRSCYYLYGV